MTKKRKQLSNPFSTGGGGVLFETHIQTFFVVLMLSRGFPPCMPCWPINKIKLQGKYDGYDTDDMIIFIQQEGGTEKRKLLCQIKHSISFTEKNNKFYEVIQSAWNDYNNENLFIKGKDALAFITGPLTASDIYNVRTTLEWARHSENSDDFLKRVEQTHFSNEKKRNVLRAFRTNINKANDGNPVSDDILFDFLKHINLHGLDLDIKEGLNLSFIRSLISQYSRENVLHIWSRLVDEVQSVNKNAGVISLDSIPDDIRNIFIRKTHAIIPGVLSEDDSSLDLQDWSQIPNASDLAIINLLGSWNEDNEADRNMISILCGHEYYSWISNIREIIQQPSTPLSLRNGKWHVSDRLGLWKSLGSRIYDNKLDIFLRLTTDILTEHDPQFDLPVEERFAAGIHGKVLNYSSEIRWGVAESLALLGTHSNDLTNCSQNKPKSIVNNAIRNIFNKANWILWGTLNDLLPLISESDPDEFLNIVDRSLQEKPCPFDELFSQEGDGIISRNYLTGLFWALETLAWDEIYFLRACVILGELASLDPGGRTADRPINSLIMILLPWYPQTTSSFEKRRVLFSTLVNDLPDIAWKLVINLLPNQHQTSTGTQKPTWRDSIPMDWKEGVSKKEYWEQIFYYADLAVVLADDNLDKLKELINHYNNLPQPSRDKLLQQISSETIIKREENEKFILWDSLAELISKNKKFRNAKWILDSNNISKIEEIVSILSPKNKLLLNIRLFKNNELYILEESGDWEEQRRKLKERRQNAIKEILDGYGINAIFQFAESVEAPYYVGYYLGLIANSSVDLNIFPKFLNTEELPLAKFTSGYIAGRYDYLGWLWVDELSHSSWTIFQLSQFLCFLPFTNATWERVITWLGDFEENYWIKVVVNPFQANTNLETAIEKLITYGRPNAAIDCLNKIHNDKQALDKSLCVHALLDAVTTKEPIHTIDTYHIIEIIKVLQNDPNTDLDDIYRVEWAYLPLFDRERGISPRFLEKRLASDPDFFCYMIRLLYRSKKVSKQKKEPNEREKDIARNAWNLLYEWHTPPGLQPDGILSQENFIKWLEDVKKASIESGHIEVTLIHIGQVMIYCPSDPQGLWIDHAVANALNAPDAENMRKGFRNGMFNSRGVHWIDPSGKPEKELANEYKQKAEELDNAGYYRFASTMRSLADEYEQEAERIIANHQQDND